MKKTCKSFIMYLIIRYIINLSPIILNNHFSLAGMPGEWSKTETKEKIRTVLRQTEQDYEKCMYINNWGSFEEGVKMDIRNTYYYTRARVKKIKVERKRLNRYRRTMRKRCKGEESGVIEKVQVRVTGVGKKKMKICGILLEMERTKKQSKKAFQSGSKTYSPASSRK